MISNFIKAFNLKIHPWSMQKSLNFIVENIEHRDLNILHIVINVAKIVNAQKKLELRNAINNSDIVDIDGLPVVWVLRLLGHDIPERVAGIDLFQNLIKLCAQKGYRPYFLGAKEDVLIKMVMKFKKIYPYLQIAGYRNGYFNFDQEEEIVNNIKKSKPNMLFLGISSPKKEIFIDKYSKTLNIPFTMGVGGSFDIVAGITKRAPKWMQNCGLEWFYRLCQEPQRMWKRYLVTNTLFGFLALKEIINHYAKKLR